MIPKFDIVTPIWGNEFIINFIDITLPCILQNICDFKYKNSTSLQIYTTKNYANSLNNSVVLSKIREHIPAFINFLPIDNLPKYQAFSVHYNDAIKRSYQRNSNIIGIMPDAFISNNTFKGIADVYDSGKKVIVGCFMSVNIESIKPILLKKYFNNDSFCMDLPPREMAKLTIEHLHGLWKHILWDNMKGDDLWGAMAGWEIKNEGILIRIFHPHPLLMCPTDFNLIDKENKIIKTIDGWEYIMKACPNIDDIYIIDDTDNMNICGFDSTDYRKDCWGKNLHITIDEEYKLKWYIDWARMFANSHQREFFKKNIRIHYTDITKEKWESAENDAERISNKILEGIKDYIAKTEYEKI